MSAVVSLHEVVEELDVPVSECSTYLNRKTGVVVVVTEEDSMLLGEDVDEDELSEWQVERLSELREVTTSEDYVLFSLQDDFDEYRLMERFIAALEDREVAAKLQRSIQGRGAFRYFKDTAREHGLLDDWFDHRQQALEELVAEWLEDNGIEFTRP